MFVPSAQCKTKTQLHVRLRSLFSSISVEHSAIIILMSCLESFCVAYIPHHNELLAYCSRLRETTLLRNSQLRHQKKVHLYYILLGFLNRHYLGPNSSPLQPFGKPVWINFIPEYPDVGRCQRFGGIAVLPFLANPWFRYQIWPLAHNLWLLH